MDIRRIERVAAASPNALALVTIDGQELSFSKVVETIQKFATGLRQAGVRPGQRVIVSVDNNAVRVLLLMAAARLGAVAVLGSSAAQARQHGVQIDHTVVLPDQVEGEAGEIIFGQEWGQLQPDQAAPMPDAGLVQTTSGSTGAPKYMQYPPGLGAVREDHIDATIPAPGGPNMCGLSVMSMGGLRYFLRSLYHVQAHIMPGTGAGPTLDRAARYGVKDLMAPGPMLADLAEAKRLGAGKDLSLTRIETVGSSVSEQLLNSAEIQFGCAVTVLYGTSEISFVTVGTPLHDGYEPGLVGKPVSDDIEVRLVDDNGQPVEQGSIGRAFIRIPRARRVGPYLNAEGPFDAEGWFGTGDRLRQRPDGQYVHCGRVGGLINTGAQAWQPEIFEVSALTDSAVRHVAAYPIMSAEGYDFVGIALETDDPGAAGRVKTVLGVSFPSVRKFVVVALPALPRTPSGKIDRVALAQAAQASHSRSSGQGEGVP